MTDHEYLDTYDKEFSMVIHDGFAINRKYFESKINNLLEYGQFVEAFLAVDTAKSQMFHKEIINRKIADLGDFDFSKKPIDTFMIYTNKAAVLNLLNYYKNSLIINYYISDDIFLIFLLGYKNNRPIVRAIKGDDYILKSIIESYYHYQEIMNSSEDIFGTSNRDINEILLDLYKFHEYLMQIIKRRYDKSENLILVPHRYLHSLPLHIGGSLEIFNDISVFKQVYYLPSIGLWANKNEWRLERLRKNKDFKPKRFFVFNETDLKTSSAEKDFLSVVEMTFLRENSCEYYNADISNMKCDYSGYDIFHFSGHTEYSPGNWENTNLKFTNGKISAKDILDKFWMPDTRFTFLASCSTGINEYEFKTELDRYTGLDLAFWLAGSNHVISTFWNIPDIPAFLYTLLFYHFMTCDNKMEGRANALAIIYLRDGFWKNFIKERITAMKDGLWPEKYSNYLRPKLEECLKFSEDAFSNIVYWGGFKILG